MRGLVFSLLVLAAVTKEVEAFLLIGRSRLLASPPSFSTVCRQTAAADAETAEDAETEDVTCYVVNDEEMIEENADPQVVCTSEPDDYAWFNGIDPKAMRETDGTEEGAGECVETENYKGKPEWECK
mmetsp:Transcript_1078/g.2518  ORF Transcript_1078/g.2518 Transcript_1078/m.2518 type:complete len:127 (+) Transcript_1078:172-552(+)